MKVAVVVGVVVPHDAISAAAVEQVLALRSLPEVDEVVLFTHGIERDAPCRTHVVGTPWELARHPDFRDADVAIFHWGIYFALFDALTLLAGGAGPSPVVHFHNCTPVALVEDEYREGIVRSIRQLHHTIALGIPFWTYSEFNRRTLLEWGATDDQIDWVTFPVSVPARSRRERRDDAPLRLLSVGRLVPAKGVHVLIDALGLLPKDLLERTFVRAISSTTFSSSSYRRELERRLHDDVPPLVAKSVRFDTSPSDEELMQAFQEADVMVSTSFHEGLCVPVIEAYAAGCRAIGTTAGNLPYIVAPPDPVVPPGDPVALARAIEEVAAALDLDDPAYDRRRSDLVESFSVRSATSSLRSALGRVPDRRTGDLSAVG